MGKTWKIPRNTTKKYENVKRVSRKDDELLVLNTSAKRDCGDEAWRINIDGD